MMVSPQISETFTGTLKHHVPLARYNTWRVGGCAKHLYLPSSVSDLQSFLLHHSQEPIHFLGLGSNTLFRDGGLDATVILTLRGLMQMEQQDTTQIYVESGVPCAKVARFAARTGLTGAEFLAGIPGTIGGALTMNAGCHHDETWNHVVSVKTMDQKGYIRERFPEEFKIGYRHVHLPQQEWFISAIMQFDIDIYKKALENINTLLAIRANTQPTSEHNAGSVFRNPEGDYAARLIEAAGLKGYRIHQACVSEKHANFITNTGQCTAADIEALIEHVQQCVFEKFGISLQREIRIFGKK